MPEWKETVSLVIIYTGVLFMVTSTLGILRFPDYYIRISTVAKALTLGVTLILIGIAAYFNTLEVVSKVIMIFFFMVITTPVAAHIIARAAVQKRVPFWYKTSLDNCKPYIKQQQEEDNGEKKDK